MAHPKLAQTPDADDGAGQRELHDTPASELRTVRPVWLWKQRLRCGCVSVVQGAKSVGKSTWLRAVAADVTGGPRLPGEARKPRVLGSVLWYAGEEDLEGCVKPGLHAAGADLTLCRCADPWGEDPEGILQLPADCERLERRILAVRAALVVVDPVFAFADASCDLEGPTMPARRFMRSVSGVAKRTGAVLILARNTTKDTSRGALAAGRGSGEIGNHARAVLHLDRMPDSPGLFALAVAALNDGGIPPALLYAVEPHAGAVRVAHRGCTELDADRLAAGDEGALDDAQLDRAKALLRSLIPSGRLDSKIVKSKGLDAMIPERTMQKAARALGMGVVREGSKESTVSYWTPPKGGWGAAAPPCTLPRTRRRDKKDQ